MKRLFFVLALLLSVTPLFAANLPVKRMALFIGANQGGTGRQPLLYAQKDALKMQQVMQEVGGVLAADRILLLDPTPSEVRDALSALASRMGAPSGSETRRTEFLFYYSGHSDDTGLLLGDQSLSYKALRDGLQTVPADVRIAILDSCSSGAFARLKGGVQRAPFLDQDSSQMKGHAFLTSSSENEASQESDTLQGSFFTHYLVSGLRGGADRVGDGLITLNEAYEYAFQNTLARTESTRAGPQHPSYEIQLSGTGNLVLSDVKTSTARLEFSADVVGKLYVRNLQGQLFAEVNKDPGTPLTLAFPSGTYTVTAVTTQKSLSSRVTLSSQGTTSVGVRDFQEQDLARFAVRGSDNEEVPAAPEWSPLSLGLIPGLPGSGWGGDKTLALSAFLDWSNAVRGVQASGVMSLNATALQGLQASGIGSISEGTVFGLQSAGVFTIAGGNVQGVQTAGVFNIAGGADNGAWQAGGVFNIARGAIRGVQMAGVFNIAAGTENGAWQTAGVFNLSRGTLRGVQTAGVVNIGDVVEGLQMAVVNIGGEVKGFQFGLVNINSHIEGGGLGLIFISPDAYYHPTLLTDDQGDTHSLFQWGMGSLYWMTGLVGRPLWKWDGASSWKGLAGVGWKAESHRVFWDTDGGWMATVGRETYTGGNFYLRSALGLDLGLAAVEVGLLVVQDSTGSSWIVGPLEIRERHRWFAGLRFL